jgi:hypothetical protein
VRAWRVLCVIFTGSQLIVRYTPCGAGSERHYIADFTTLADVQTAFYTDPARLLGALEVIAGSCLAQLVPPRRHRWVCGYFPAAVTTGGDSPCPSNANSASARSPKLPRTQLGPDPDVIQRHHLALRKVGVLY